MTLDLTIVVPTFNEAGNVSALIGRIALACSALNTEVLFVDDSTDNTPQVITEAARSAPVPVRMIRRNAGERPGGLSGAVLNGLRGANADWVAVMDGDLQHPPELLPLLWARSQQGDADVVVASRYCNRGSAVGLANGARRAVSNGSTVLAKSLFPQYLKGCSDPMTGYFMLHRPAIDLMALQPCGFKILLEILVRCPLRVAEEPFIFDERFSGESKASLRQGLHFMRQIAALRFAQGRTLRYTPAEVGQ